MAETPAATWHASALYSLLHCGEAYRRRYLEREGQPPTTALIRGSAVHRGVGAGLLLHKAQQAPAPVDLFEDVSATEIDRARHGGATFTKDEASAGMAKTWGTLKDKVVRLAGGYGRMVAPAINPVAVERKITIEGVLPGIRLAGTLDLVDRVNGHDVVRDVKTSDRAPRQSQADDSDQLTMYAILRAAETGEPVTETSLDYMVDKPATGEVVSTRLTSARGPADRAALLARIVTAQAAVAAGVFLPAPRDSWVCSSKWCAFWSTCKYVGN